MKKFFGLIWISLILAYMSWGGHALALPTTQINEVSFYPESAKVGETVKINYTIYNNDPAAKWVLLRIYDVGETREEMYQAKDKREVVYDGQKAYVYSWDTAAAQSKPGDHRIDVTITPLDEAASPLATSRTTYTLLAAGVPVPSPSASTPTGTHTGSVVSSPPGGTTNSLFPSNPEKWTLQTIFDIINNILTFVSISAGALAVLLIVWEAFAYFMAFGSEEKVEAAKKNIVYILSGLGVIILAKVLVAFLLSIFQ